MKEQGEKGGLRVKQHPRRVLLQRLLNLCGIRSTDRFKAEEGHDQIEVFRKRPLGEIWEKRLEQ